MTTTFTDSYIRKLNEDIAVFPQVTPIKPDFHITRKGVSQLVMLDRYAFKDIEKRTLSEGDFVIVKVNDDPKFPALVLGFITNLDRKHNRATIALDEDFLGTNGLTEEEAKTGVVVRPLELIEKPLEIFYEQIADRVARGLAAVETDEAKREQAHADFYREIVSDNFVPAGRILYGAGSGNEVTFFNCFVMPYPKDSREGIAEHRGKVMEIMARGGGVGTNGSTLRPRLALARGVGGKSSGSVSWLNDIAQLTHLVEQGGSRRGAQMILLACWHPDIIEFIISKMQNPRILRYLTENFDDPEIKRLAKAKLKFKPLANDEREIYEQALLRLDPGSPAYKKAQEKLADGGTYEVVNPDFLTGANISVAITADFMEAVEDDVKYELRFPDVESYNAEEMAYYNEHWHECGDVREWPLAIKTYRTVKARELWQLICFCATYSAEPGIFFIDNANDKTNAKAYGQKVVATNPCGMH